MSLQPIRRYAGLILIVLGSIHILCTPLLYSDGLKAIVDAGILNSIGTQANRGEVFWFVGFGVMFIVVGEIVRWAQKQTGVIPPFLGWSLLVVGILAVMVMPDSPFWAITLLGLVYVAAARKPHPQRV